MLRIGSLNIMDLSSTPFASVDSSKVLSKLSRKDAGRLILASNTSILNTALPALFSSNAGNVQQSFTAHEAYYARTPILRERLWVYVLQDRAQMHLAVAVTTLVNDQQQKAHTANQMRENEREERIRTLEAERARAQRDTAVIVAVFGAVLGGFAAWLSRHR